TNPAAPRHKGITFLLIDMKSPGITVRPLRQMTGEPEFNESFFDHVRVPAENVVGAVDGGWAVALTTLSYERDLLTVGRHISFRNALDRLLALARRRPAPDPVLRQRVADLVIGERILQLNAYRALTKILRGGQPGPEGSTSKLYWSQLDQALAEVGCQML